MGVVSLFVCFWLDTVKGLVAVNEQQEVLEDKEEVGLGTEFMEQTSTTELDKARERHVFFACSATFCSEELGVCWQIHRGAVGEGASW